MAPPQQIVVKIHNIGSSGQAWRLLNGTTLDSQLAGDFATVTSESTGTNRRKANRFIEFRDRAHVWAYRQNFSLTSSGGSWVENSSDNNIDQNAVSGIHLLHPNGTPTVCFMAKDRITGNVVLRSSVSTTWSTSSVRANPGGLNGRGIAVPYRDALFWCARVSGVTTVMGYDLASSTFTDFLFSGTYAGSSADDMVVHDNRLFWLGVTTNSSTANYELRIQDGANFNLQATLTDVERGTSDDGGGPCMFTDPTTGDLIAIIPGNNTTPVVEEKVLRIQNATTTPIVTDITSATQLAIYQAGGGSVSDRSQWYCNVDNNTDPTNPAVYLWRLSGPGLAGSWKAYQWNGIGSTMTDLGGVSASFNSDFVVSHRRYGGGNMRPAQVDASSRLAFAGSAAESAGGILTRQFRVWGSGPALNAKLYFSSDESAPNTEATLADVNVVSGSPSTTPVLSGNTITNLTPDDGATLYSFGWQASTDGITEGQGYTLMLNPV